MFPTFYIEFQHSYISHRILQDSTSSEYYISHILLHVISKIPPVLPPLRAEGGGGHEIPNKIYSRHMFSGDFS